MNDTDLDANEVIEVDKSKVDYALEVKELKAEIRQLARIVQAAHDFDVLPTSFTAEVLHTAMRQADKQVVERAVTGFWVKPKPT